ncbi:related to DHA14-like major facilitator, ABC transporter [Rhynchosporium agropyri]|uniref:Related to DHA14-like major facilitator, ABC transporter n=1 Tax=Rhynchosporium agropyri TaxID=914238 RepID=A0A1E1LPT1_9HELO|nr:related to DHA14-like major facilitator, ABC transporter [Rhynchosporium agropyri]
MVIAELRESAGEPTVADFRDDSHGFIVDPDSGGNHSEKGTANRSASVATCEPREKVEVIYGGETTPKDVQKEAGVFHESSTDVPLQESEKVYPTGGPFIILTAVLMATVFMTALDQNILSTATPKIATEFKILDDIAWYHASYGIGQMVAQPTLGKIYTYYNTKYLFLLSFLVFEVGSTLCAAAPNSVALIIGRAIAGAGYGGLYTGVLLIIVDTVPLKRRPLYMSVVGSMSAVSAVAGPLLGGVFTDSAKLKWRFAFWINLPTGFLVTIAIWLVFHPTTPEHANLSFREKLHRLDLVGAALLIPGIALLQVAIQRAGALYPWTSPNVWALLVVGGLLLVAFTWVQIRKGDRATIPPRILKNRNIYSIYLFGCSWAIVVPVHLLYLPFYFQTIKNTSAMQSGIRILPYTISTTLGGAFAGVIITIFGQYVPFLFIGSTLAAVGSGFIYTLNGGSPLSEWFGYQAMTALGYGMSVQLPLLVIQNVLDVGDIASATAVFIFFQNFVGAIVLTVAQNIFQQELKRRVGAIPGVDLKSVIEANPSEIRQHVPVELLTRVLEAFNMSLSKAFIMSIAGGSLGFLVSFGVERRKLRDGKSSRDKTS